MMRNWTIGVLGLVTATVAYSQALVPGAAPMVDLTPLQAAVSAAQGAADAANAALAGVVRKVGGSSPDTTGNVTLPNTFNGTTCAGCTMSNTALTGTTTLNGSPLLTSADSYTKTQVDGLVAPATAAIPFARTKWAGQNLTTNASGTATINIPAGRMTSGLSVSGLVVHTAGQFAVPTVTAVGTPAAGYTVTVTFTKAKQQVTVPAVVVGAGATNLSLFETQANTGVVSFDIGFTEPDVVGS